MSNVKNSALLILGGLYGTLFSFFLVRAKARSIDDFQVAHMRGELTSGRAIALRTNQFKVDINKEKIFHCYSVNIQVIILKM